MMEDKNFRNDVILYTLPMYWASYLINGDASGLVDGEQAYIDEWLEDNGNPLFVDCGEPYFFYCNDAISMGGDVCDYVARRKEG